MKIIDVRDLTECQGCGGNLTPEEAELFDGFCTKCDNEGWHYCENCAKPTNHTNYSKREGILLCEECE
jgi:hypothetical protein